MGQGYVRPSKCSGDHLKTETEPTPQM